MSDETYVRELEEYLDDLYHGRDEHVRAMRKARWGEDLTIDDVPEAYRTSTQIVVLPRNQDVLQRMTSLLTDDEPAITQPPRDISQTAKTDANQVERWCSGALLKTAADSGRDSWRYAVDAALADGMGVLKSWYKPDAWSDEPNDDTPEIGTDEEIGAYGKRREQYNKDVESYRKSASFPIALQDVDLLTYKPLHSGERVEEVLEVCERALLPTMRQLRVKAVSESNTKVQFKKLRKGEKFPVNGGLATTTRGSRKVTEHWTADTVTYYIDGVKADEREHKSGRPPYFPIAGYATSSRDPAKATRSAIAGQAPLVKSLNRWLTMMSNLGYIGAWPYLVDESDTPARGQGGPNPTAPSIAQLEAGSILKKGLKFLEVPTISRDVQNLISIHQAEADRTSLSAVMFGFAGGSTSGYQTASLQAAAQSVLRPVTRNIKTALGDLFGFWLRLVDQRIQDTVYVWGPGQKADERGWLDLSPKQIKGYYIVLVELRPLLPLDEIAQRDSAIRMHQAKLWPARYALEKTGEPQPEDLLDELAAEQYAELPVIAETIARDAAERRGLVPKQLQAPPEQPPIYGPAGEMLSGGPMGVGGPGIGAQGPIIPSEPGINMPLVSPGPAGIGGPNMPVGVQRRPGGPVQSGPLGGM